jgi:hypothetical protein
MERANQYDREWFGQECRFAYASIERGLSRRPTARQREVCGLRSVGDASRISDDRRKSVISFFKSVRCSNGRDYQLHRMELQDGSLRYRLLVRDTLTTGAHPALDHGAPLGKGGADSTSNMQWQTVKDAKEKDRWECK